MGGFVSRWSHPFSVHGQHIFSDRFHSYAATPVPVIILMTGNMLAKGEMEITEVIFCQYGGQPDLII